MCHFLVSRNFGTITNPFELPIPSLFTHYKFQQKIIRNESAVNLSLMLTSQKLGLLKDMKKEDQNDVIKQIQDLKNSLTREDLI